MKTQVILPADYRVTPWRNGTGKTAEIAVAPGESSRFAWRLSIADVPESGPFSDYPGYERIIAVVDGAGMCLTVGDRAPATVTRQSAPYAFPGNLPTTCALLGGPIRDFNLIFDPALVSGTVNLVQKGQLTLRGGIAFVYAAAGDLHVEKIPLPANATLRIDDAAGPLAIDGTALIAIVTRVP